MPILLTKIIVFKLDKLIDNFKENYAMITVDRQFGHKRGNLPRLISVREVAKTDF
jgi:hypothetical protein